MEKSTLIAPTNITGNFSTTIAPTNGTRKLTVVLLLCLERIYILILSVLVWNGYCSRSKICSLDKSYSDTSPTILTDIYHGIVWPMEEFICFCSFCKLLSELGFNEFKLKLKGGSR